MMLMKNKERREKEKKIIKIDVWTDLKGMQTIGFIAWIDGDWNSKKWLNDYFFKKGSSCIKFKMDCRKCPKGKWKIEMLKIWI